jgi:hypothetical protein
MSVKWYFPIENSPGNNYNNNLTESKFNVEKWGSFIREIVQNSADNPINEGELISIKLDVRSFSIGEIPGGVDLKDIIERSISRSKNPHIKNSLSNGLKNLNSNKIYCLKISDFRTKGMTSERSGPWGALVYDDGVSVKDIKGSGGSHGVGKKVHYLASSVNTVFYSSTHFADLKKSVFQGSTNLSIWEDENLELRSARGWLGTVNENLERENRVQPIKVNEDLDLINDFFVRKEKSGTDVIILSPNFESIETDYLQKLFIVPILENFFPAIHLSLIEFNVFGEIVNSNTLNKIMNKYYQNVKKKQPSQNLIGGNAGEYLAAMKSEPIRIPVKISQLDLGHVDLYFLESNNLGKKYYAFVRSQGMKIQDNEVESDQPFTAVLHITDNRINERIKTLENAAHDDFVRDIQNYDFEVKLLEYILAEVERVIKEKSSIEILDTIEIENFGALLGDSLGATITHKPNKVKVTKKRIRKKSNVLKPKFEESQLENIEKEKNKYQSVNKPEEAENNNLDELSIESRIKGDSPGVLVSDFEFEPTFYLQKEGYILKFKTKKTYSNSYLEIMSINNDGKINPFENFIESAFSNSIKLIVDKNLIFFSPKQEEMNLITIVVNAPIRYQLIAFLRFRR